MVFVIGGRPRSKGSTGSPSEVQTVGLPQHGIAIVGPAEAAFTRLMSQESSAPGKSGIGESSGSSVFVVNKSGRSIAALSVKWEMLQSDGRNIVHTRQYRGGLRVVFDGETAHLSETIAPNHHKLVSLLNTSDESNRSFRVNMGGGAGDVDKAHQLSKSVKVTVSVDGVLFVDGTFVGPDTRDFFESLKAEIEARTEVFEEIARALNGDSEAMKRIEALANGHTEGMQTMSRGQDHLEARLERNRIAAATLAIRKDLGDKAVLDRINAELSKPRITLRKL